MPMLQFGEWAPDQMALDNPGCVDVINVIPRTLRTYGPVAALSVFTGALGAAARGAASYRGTSGTLFNTAADATKLYQLSAGVWSDVSRLAGGAYAIAATDMAQFAQFGNLVIVVNGTDDPQKWNIGVSANYSLLGGTPPVGRFITVVKDFVVIGRITNAQNRVKWSSGNNAEAWTVGINQCDEQDIPVGGKIMGMVGGEQLYVFSERAINLFTYVGDPIIFQRQPISQERGCRAEGSIAAYQERIFFLAHDGFYLLQRGGSDAVPIGNQKIDEFFFNDVNDDFFYKITSTVDPVNTLYVVAYPSVRSLSGTCDTLLVYNWAINRWAKIVQSVELLYSAGTDEGYTMETLVMIAPDLDAFDISLDDPRLSGADVLSLAAFDTSHKLSFFNGSNMEATLETTEGQINPGGRAFLTEAWPQIDGGTLSVAIGTRDRPNDTLTWGSYANQNTVGFVPLQNNARYHRARAKIAAASTWSHAYGLDFTARKAGVY